jgi:hypothetical protein
MTGAVIMAEDPAQVKPGSQVTVVTGTDFTVNAPPTTTTPTSAGGTATSPAAPTTTTTTPASTGNTGNSGAFQAPTPSVESLAPWDPRSCTASGGEGT